MKEILSFHFLYPVILFSIIIVFFLVLFFYRNWNKTTFFWALDDVLKVFWNNAKYFKIYYAIIFCILSLFIVIFAWPVVQTTEDKTNKNGIDIMLALDVSISMLADDLKPNRLEVAKGVINDFLDMQEANRVWIVVFAGRPFNSLPLSFDYSIIKKIVSRITTDIIDQKYSHLQWTAIWDALVLADKWFKESTREKVIILITDWEANKWLDPLLSLKLLKENNVKVYTIGIWWLEKAYVTLPFFAWWYQKVEVWGVDEETLKKIAGETWWKYFRASSENALEDIFLEIDKLEKREIDVKIVKNNIEKNNIFVYAILFLMLILFWLKYYKRIK